MSATPAPQASSTAENEPATTAAGSWLDREPEGARGWAKLLVLPFVVRIVVALELATNPLDQLPIVDAEAYDTAAKRIVDGSFSMTGPFWQPPSYQYFLAGIYAAFGHAFGAVRAVQALLGAGSCVLVFVLTRRLFGTRPAWIAYLMASLCGSMVLQDYEILPASLFGFLQLALLWGVTRDKITTKAAVGLGACFGLAAITVANILITLPLFVAYLIKRHATTSRAALRLGAAWLVGTALVVAPVTAANYEASGEFVLISYNGGINFFIGNNPDHDTTVAIRPGYQWRKLDFLPSLEGNAMSPGESSAFFVRKSLTWMKREPLAFARLLGKKTRLLVSGVEIFRNQEIYPLRHESRLLAALLWHRGVAFPFGVVLPLALVGIVQSSRTARDASLRRFVLAYAAVYALSVLAFFVTGRYRLPLVPILLPFAALAVHRGMERWRAGARKAVAASLAGVAALVWLCNAWNVPSDEEFGSGTLAALGLRELASGHKQGGTDTLQRAIDLDRENVDAALPLAQLYLRERRPDRALAALAGLDGSFPELHLADRARNVGPSPADAMKRGEELVAELEPIVNLWPERAEVQLKWAERLRASGSIREAEIHRQQAAEMLASVAWACTRAGRVDCAEQNYDRALALRPSFVEAMNGLGMALASRQEWPRAVELWRRALKVDPRNADAKALLASAPISDTAR